MYFLSKKWHIPLLVFPVLSTEVPVIILLWKFDWQAVWPIITHTLPFLSNKQTRQESRLTLVDLNLKNGVYWSLSAVETSYLLMFIHVYFALYLVNVKRWSVHVPLELRHYSDLSRHIKEPQNGFYCVNFLKKLQNLKAETLFHT